MVRVDPLPVIWGITYLAPQREVGSREPEGGQDSSRTCNRQLLTAKRLAGANRRARLLRSGGRATFAAATWAGSPTDPTRAGWRERAGAARPASTSVRWRNARRHGRRDSGSRSRSWPRSRRLL